MILVTAMILPGLYARAQARDASVMIDKENRNAVMISIDQPDNITRDALQQRLQRSGLNERARKGIVRYKRVTLSEIGPDQVDIYTKVEKGPNNSSVVYMAVSRGYNSFTNNVTDSAMNQKVKDFLQAFVQDANLYSADVKITNQLYDVTKDEKAYQKLLDEQIDLQKKKAAIENRLTAIQSELTLKNEEINKKKSGVEDAKIRRSNPGS